MNQQQSLESFVSWWQEYCKGDEKGESQVFLDRLFRAFGHLGVREAGGILEERIKHKRGDKMATAFADLVVPGLVLIEMKKRGEDLRKHYAQAFEYWMNLVPNRPKYVILCNFDELWIYDLNHQLEEPMDKVAIKDLPKRWGPLGFLFLQPKVPLFQTDLVAVTEQAARNLSNLFTSLLERKIDRPVAQRLVLQCLLALFAEDIDLLPKYTFTRVVEDCIEGQSSYDLLTLLFESMNRPGGSQAGRFQGVNYFNGGIFAHIEPVDLSKLELNYLHSATQHNWAGVMPAIFGTIFEKSMGEERRHQEGAHFTYEVDIQRIVQPVIVRPWRERIEAAQSVNELLTLQHELSQYQVLDPACGSGNFLYIAYREMKRLEKEILDRVAQMRGVPALGMGLVNARQFWGFDINPFAVELAKVTLMIAKKLSVDELGLHEDPLPLDNLDKNIRDADALLEPWPEFDACIGNPPYMGAKVLKTEHDVAYVNRIRELFHEVPGNADYCVYWFRKAHELMKPGARAGLVGTNTIRQNYSRIGGLDYIVGHDGHIFEAVSSMEWRGEAAVSVSIACWSKGESPTKTSRLWLDNGDRVIEELTINSALSPNIDVSTAYELSINVMPKRVFNGQVPGDNGFVLKPDLAEKLLKKDSSSQQAIFPFLIGSDLVAKPGGRPSRFIIDLSEYDVMGLQKFSAVFEYLKLNVLPDREAKAKKELADNEHARSHNPRAKINHDHETALRSWWQLARSRPEMLVGISRLSRYIVCSEVTKYPIFELISPEIRPGNRLQIFMFQDDYSFGILQSGLHWKWFTEKGSTLTERFTYTPHSVFDTFPWPQQPNSDKVKAVADAARTLHEWRQAAMKRDPKMTLRKMYSSLELPGNNPLRDLHTTLDKAVIAAYGFDPKGDMLAQLLELNETVYTRIQAGEPVTAPGVPHDYPDPKSLVSEGCVQPREVL